MTEAKICYSCKTLKNLNLFNQNKSKKDKHSTECKECVKKYNDNYRSINIEKLRLYDKKRQPVKSLKEKKFRTEHPELVRNKDKERRQKRNKQKTRETARKYFKIRKQLDPVFKFRCTARAVIARAFSSIEKKIFKKNLKTEQLLGCTIPELYEHLVKQFKPGMTLENHGKWHVDHTIPLALAKTQEEVEKLCHYTNLQPLWAKENLSKGSKYG